MLGGPMRMLSESSRKPQNVSATLARFGHYFKPYWPVLVAIVVIVIVSTWSQVTTPDLTGQVVDCYLTPAAANTFGNFPGQQQVTSGAETNCWLSKGIEATDKDLTHQLIRSVATAINLPRPSVDNSQPLSDADRLAGLGGMIAI